MTVEFSAWALAFINPTFPDLVRANAAARILYTYFDLPEPMDIGDSSSELTGAFAVRNVSFAYPTRPQQKVAKQLAISANAGESIALVGPSGTFFVNSHFTAADVPNRKCYRLWKKYTHFTI